MNNQTQEKKYVCKSCGSKASGTPGTCCGAEREEKKEAGVCMACSCPCDEHKEHTHDKKDNEGSAKKCEACGHEHKSNGTCDCGCK